MGMCPRGAGTSFLLWLLLPAMVNVLVPSGNYGTPATVENLHQILIGKYFFLGTLTMLLYDHILTLPAEVQTVWKKKKTYVLCLFLFVGPFYGVIVRYYALFAVIIVAFGFFSTEMTRERCAHWMLFLPLGVTVPLMLFPGILMLIRVYALYNRNKVVLFGLSTILLAQTIAGIWQYSVSGGTPAPDPIDNYEFHFCIYLPPKKLGRTASMYVFMELGYDTLIFFLTLGRTSYMFWRHQGRGPSSRSLLDNLIRDGAFYFAVIFSINLTWVVMILYAPTGLRAISSIPSACITTVMICRITLNLRVTVYGPPRIDERTGNANEIPLSKLRSLRSPRAANFTTPVPRDFPSVSPPRRDKGKDRDSPVDPVYEETRGWRHSESFGLSRSPQSSDEVYSDV
ncbi:hypothetical protein EVG20_g2506 [Dentipellis fragilis]|uniref:DUF6533 domain-containing protein n=1 Tax=Dentipellis fragilis TaxID=205917 RepID=A0A4Y9Z8X7_9AGAM|nr:hypothetical protein EVG20_g2506 [Dentipellis fragilis]